jgi:hypothetical protein
MGAELGWSAAQVEAEIAAWEEVAATEGVDQARAIGGGTRPTATGHDAAAAGAAASSAERVE